MGITLENTMRICNKNDTLFLSKNQLNQQPKWMVEALGYVIYSNMPLHTRALWGRSVDATQALFIPDTKYFTLNLGIV